MHPTSYIELSQTALEANIAFIRQILGTTEFSAVVKGNAYGHGIDVYCPMLYKAGVRHFSVFSAHEAELILSTVPTDSTIMVMGYLSDQHLMWAIQNEVEFFVFEQSRLEKAIQIAKQLNKSARIHLEFETGMNRTGFNPMLLNELIAFLQVNRNVIDLIGVCSHLAGAESIVNRHRIEKQVICFKELQNRIQQALGTTPKFHLACSAACLQFPETQLDLARIGILQYGFFPSDEVLVQYFSKHKTQTDQVQKLGIRHKFSLNGIKNIQYFLHL